MTTFFEGSKNPETKRRLYLPCLIYAVGVVTLIPFALLAYRQNDLTLMAVDLFAGVGLFFNVVHARRYKRHDQNILAGTVLAACLFVYTFLSGGVSNSAFVWYYVFPLIAFFLLGTRRGAIASLLMLIPVFILFAMDSPPAQLADYHRDLKLRFVPSYVVVSVFAYVFEYTRAQAQKSLRRIQEGPEVRVEQRTHDLTESNRKLRLEIEEKEPAQLEREDLQRRLVRAEKMEALGVLAGGVAHDLNNILAGVVTYPDLILLKLPPGSPLREDILKVRESGERAAAVVQDLLTMARSGVPNKKVFNLNQVLKEFRQSPEYNIILTLRPDVEVLVSPDDDLLNIVGSSTQLMKVLMNLVSNAVEAMPDGGTVRVETQNRSLTQRHAPPGDCAEGEYVLLRVTDNGSGISSEDLGHIFEPFYTQKTMGRSGSGLGLAVVWGTITDHDGFIDVKSEVNLGTIFSIFFPATRQQATLSNLAFSHTDYLGNGETLLVVDDVAEQRLTASEILTKLGYKVVTAAGGQEALDYLREGQADLLLLDMIMDPGMDGLETFQKVLEINPEQKVIIVSGHAEAEKVHQVMRLGAIQLI